MAYHELFIQLPKDFFYYYFTWIQKEAFCRPIVRNIFLLILTVIITKDLTFTSAELRDLKLYGPLSSVARLRLSMLRFFLLTLSQKFSNCYPLPKFLNIFQTLDREQRKLILTSFNLESILSSLALETGAMNNNLIINSMSLQPLVLSAAKILCH